MGRRNAWCKKNDGSNAWNQRRDKCRGDACPGKTIAEREARDVWLQSGDARLTHRLMPRSRHLQRALLARLAGEATDGGGAGAGRARRPNGWEAASARRGLVDGIDPPQARGVRT